MLKQIRWASYIMETIICGLKLEGLIFFRSLGYTYKRLEQEGIILPVVESSCKYFKPAMYDEEVLIRTTVELQKGIRIGFKYEVLRKEDETLLAEGRTLHAFVGTDLKPIRLKSLNEDFRALLEKVKP